jgi:hypothetical protein
MSTKKRLKRLGLDHLKDSPAELKSELEKGLKKRQEEEAAWDSTREKKKPPEEGGSKK